MCEILSGLASVCDDAGGIQTWYAVSTKEIASTTVVGGLVTSITMNAGKFAYPFNVEMETSNFTDKAIGERANSAYAREQAATIKVSGNTAEMIVAIEDMCKDRVTLFVKLNDGSMEVAFLENGAKLSDERDTGTAFEDFNGNTLTAAGKEKSKAPKIGESLVLALLP